MDLFFSASMTNSLVLHLYACFFLLTIVAPFFLSPVCFGRTPELCDSPKTIGASDLSLHNDWLLLCPDDPEHDPDEFEARRMIDRFLQHRCVIHYNKTSNQMNLNVTVSNEVFSLIKHSPFVHIRAHSCLPNSLYEKTICGDYNSLSVDMARWQLCAPGLSSWCIRL